MYNNTYNSWVQCISGYIHTYLLSCNNFNYSSVWSLHHHLFDINVSIIVFCFITLQAQVFFSPKLSLKPEGHAVLCFHTGWWWRRGTRETEGGGIQPHQGQMEGKSWVRLVSDLWPVTWLYCTTPWTEFYFQLCGICCVCCVPQNARKDFFNFQLEILFSHLVSLMENVYNADKRTFLLIGYDLTFMRFSFFTDA